MSYTEYLEACTGFKWGFFRPGLFPFYQGEDGRLWTALESASRGLVSAIPLVQGTCLGGRWENVTRGARIENKNKTPEWEYSSISLGASLFTLSLV